jgi:hypothetical protein
MSEFERGVVVGLMIGEAHFGGEGTTPACVIKMHVRHEPLLRWLHGLFPRSRLYGPYSYSGRHFFQWMLRGRAVEDLLALIEDDLNLDPHTSSRVQRMRERHMRRPGVVPS